MCGKKGTTPEATHNTFLWSVVVKFYTSPTHAHTRTNPIVTGDKGFKYLVNKFANKVIHMTNSPACDSLKLKIKPVR